MANEYQLSALAFEVVRDGEGAIQLSTLGFEVVRDGPSAAEISTLGFEVVRSIEFATATARRRQMTFTN